MRTQARRQHTRWKVCVLVRVSSKIYLTGRVHCRSLCHCDVQIDEAITMAPSDQAGNPPRSQHSELSLKKKQAKSQETSSIQGQSHPHPPRNSITPPPFNPPGQSRGKPPHTSFVPRRPFLPRRLCVRTAHATKTNQVSKTIQHITPQAHLRGLVSGSTTMRTSPCVVDGRTAGALLG